MLGIRGSALLTPDGLPTWHYAPAKAASILRHEASETFDMDLDRALRALADEVEKPEPQQPQGAVAALEQIDRETRHISGNAGRLGQIARDALAGRLAYVRASDYEGAVDALGAFIEASAGPIGRLRVEGHPDADVLYAAIKAARAAYGGR